VIIIEFFDAALLDQRKTFGRSIGHSLVRSRVGLASLSLFRAFISRSDWGYARRPALTEKRELTVKGVIITKPKKILMEAMMKQAKFPMCTCKIVIPFMQPLQAASKAATNGEASPRLRHQA
jgi:hypothetical protein